MLIHSRQLTTAVYPLNISFPRIERGLLVLAVTAACAFSVIGCGSSSDSNSAGSSGTSTSTDTTTAASTASTATASGSIVRNPSTTTSSSTSTGSTATTVASTTTAASTTSGSTTTAASTTSAATTAATTTAATTTASSTSPSTSTTTASASTAIASGATTTVSSTKKSVSSYVSCSGSSDDTAGLAKAFAAAAHGAFTLVIDCPVNVKIGSDIARPIFVDDDTSVEFTGNGKFTVDNQFIPAFVLANSNNITLTNWNVEYVGGISVIQAATFENNGQTSVGKPGNMFNDVRLTDWLAANRAIVFDAVNGVNSQWAGTTNACAVFLLTGDTSNVSVTGMQLYVPTAATGSQFIPVAFTLSMNYKSSQTLKAGLPATSKYFALPHNLTFSNLRLDGTYMGFVGGVQNTLFENITSQRYGDLQDAQGNNVGGVLKWFAPPHLFYFNNPSTDSSLFTQSLAFTNVVDSGIRIGRARDAGGSDTVSGYALSLKLACVNCSVDTYASARPDGFMDVLGSNGVTVSNVTASYDSAFTNNMYPGWRFPASGYTNLKYQNISLTDTAASTTVGPIGPMNDTTNQAIVMSNVTVNMTKWTGSTPQPYPGVGGQDNNVQLNFLVNNNDSQHVQAVVATVEGEIQALPVVVKVGQPAALTWTSHQASSCAGGGSWTSLTGVGDSAAGTSGGATFIPKKTGSYTFTLECRNASSASTATVIIQATS